MKKILFPTEFSEHAPEIFKYAVELAYFFKAQLVVMHAYNHPELKFVTKEDLVNMRDEASGYLVEFVATHLNDPYRGIDIDYVVNPGFAPTAILDFALEEDIDIIVMGGTGKTNALDTLFGSTTLEVLAKANCPVLIIPADAKFEGIDNIAYATNFRFRDLEAINYLKKWSKTFNAPIHCLHVLENKKGEMKAKKNLNILKETFKNQKRMMFDMARGDFQKEIQHFAKGKSADILAMMLHKQSFISRLLVSSSVKGVAQRIYIPLLVMKDNPYEIDKSGEWLQIVNSIA